MLRPNKTRRVPWVTINDLEFDELPAEPELEDEGPEEPEPKYSLKYVVQDVLGQRAPSFIFATSEQDARTKGQLLGYGGFFSGGILVTFLGRFRCPGES